VLEVAWPNICLLMTLETIRLLSAHLHKAHSQTMSEAEQPLNFFQEVARFRKQGPYTFEEVCRLAARADGTAHLNNTLDLKAHLFSPSDFVKLANWRQVVAPETVSGWEKLLHYDWSLGVIHPDLPDKYLEDLADFPEAAGKIIRTQLEWGDLSGDFIFELLVALRTQEVAKRDRMQEEKKIRRQEKLKACIEKTKKLKAKLEEDAKKTIRDSSPTRK
jgi:hypothetical protein